MITIDFALSHSSIRIVSRKLVTSKSQNYVKAHFDLLSDDWTAPITAIFRADNNAYSVLLDEDNICTVPWEVLTTAGTVNVSAFCGNRHTANIAQFDVVQSGYTDGETLVKQTYVEQTNPVGVADNPFEFVKGVMLIPNAYYTYNGKRYVYVGMDAKTATEWNESEFEEF